MNAPVTNGSFRRFQEFQNVERVLSILESSWQAYYIDRPILLHGENKTGVKCPCGCNSKEAVIIDEIPHLEVLFDAFTGERKVRHRLEAERQLIFDEIKVDATCKRIYSPVRCYKEQLEVFLDRFSTIQYITGGHRGGKTTILAERFWSLVLEDGDVEAQFAWVAPTRRHIWRGGVRKLIKGDTTDRRVAPLIPSELIVRGPKKFADADWTVRLLDGSEITWIHAGNGTDGDQIKTNSYRHAAFDEVTSSKSEGNFRQLRSRIIETGGTLALASTPKPDHYMRKWYEGKPTYAQVRESREEAARQDIPYEEPYEVSTTLTAFINPFFSKKKLAREIEAAGGADHPQVQQEWYGNWSARTGEKLWWGYDAIRNLECWTERDFEVYEGFRNKTPDYVREKFFGISNVKNAKFVAGMDFNVRPMSLLVGRIIVRSGKDVDARDPANHILYIEDEIVKVAKSTIEFADFVANRAGSEAGRGLKRDHFRGMHIVCDASGFWDGTRVTSSGDKTADVKYMRQEGFVCRAPAYSRNGKKNPYDPPRRVRHAKVNEMLQRGRILINRNRCPNLIASLENEIDPFGSGDQSKRSNTRADRLSGITDALGYLVYALFYLGEDSGKLPFIRSDDDQDEDAYGVEDDYDDDE